MHAAPQPSGETLSPNQTILFHIVPYIVPILPIKRYSICLLLVDVALREAIHRFHQSTDKTMLHLQGSFRPRSPEMNIYLAKKATKKGRNIQKLSTRAITEWYQGGINCCMFAIRLQPTTTTASRNKARPRS